MSHKKILITGGAGFIGSHLCEKLLNKDNEVLCLDNYFTGSKNNIFHLMDNSHFKLVQQDVTDTFHSDIDEIYNLACPASPVHYQYNPIKTTITSVVGAINMLNIAKNQKIKILQASTSEVYGDPRENPQSEFYWGNVNPIGIRACYDEGKRCAESLFMDYNRQYKVPIKIIRIFNTYGPKMSFSDGRIISTFILQALKNQDITIFGDGTQTRSFQYIDDLLEAMIEMMATEELFTGPINIGNPEEFTILEVANLIIDITSSKSKIAFYPLPQDDPKQRKPDITLAKKKLNWIPQIKLREGLIKTIEYFDKELSLKNKDMQK